MKTRTYLSVIFIIILCLTGCKSKENTTQTDLQKTQESVTEPQKKPETDTPPAQTVEFKSLKDADDAINAFMEGIQAIAEKNEGNCDESAKAIHKYYQDNAEKIEKAMQFASKLAEDDKEGENKGEIFNFFRFIENAASGALSYTEKLDPCADNEQLKTFWEEVRKLLEKYEPADVANEGNLDEEESSENEAPVKDGMPDPDPLFKTFNSLKEADEAAHTFMKGFEDIATRTKLDCFANASETENYYQENIQKFEDALQFAANYTNEDFMGVLDFFRFVENKSSEFSDSKRPCTEIPELNKVWKDMYKTIQKFEPKIISDELIEG